MQYSAYSNVGGRANNEDSLVIEESHGCVLFAVADGLGGVEAGEIASGTAVEELKNQFLFEPQSFNLSQALVAANAEILRIQESSAKKMKTTITAVYVSYDGIQCAHVGDSRIYMFGKNGIVYQSVDHSVSQMAVLAGEIKPEDIRNHEDRNMLTKALGVSDNLTVDVKKIPAENVSAILLCSDGFWEYVYEEEMIKILGETDNPEEWINEMRTLLMQRKPDKNDNNTAIAVIL